MDGHAFCRAVRSDPDTDFLPVILLTAEASPEGRLKGLEGGADDYITKPFEPAELLARDPQPAARPPRLKARFATQPSASPACLRARGTCPRPTPFSLVEAASVLDRDGHDEAFDVTALAGGAG